MSERTIFIGIGGNLPLADGTLPLQVCQNAVGALRSIQGLRLTGLSRWFETTAIPASDQPRYVNGVARLEGALAPEALLETLQGIERQFDRTRGAANAARTLDLDIIAMGDLIRAAPDPVLPHPRMHLRAFVLAPLAELAAGWRHPVLGRTVQDLLDALPDQGVFALAMEPPSA